MAIEYLTDDSYELRDKPLAWQLQGLSQTASGYGSRLASTRQLRLIGEKVWRRIYVTCYSNAGSAWVTIRGKRFYLRS